MGISQVVGLAAIACLFLALSAMAQEKKIKRSDLPTAVEKTVVAQSSGVSIQGFSEEREKGQTLYEAEMTVNGHSQGCPDGCWRCNRRSRRASRNGRAT